MGSQKEYNPKRHKVLISGVQMTGFAEDVMFTFEESGPLFNVVQGVDGQVSRSRNYKQTGLLTIHLMNTSRSNAVLSALAQLGISSEGGEDVVAVLVTDDNGTSKIAADTAWIEERPKPSRGTQASANEWKIRVANYVFFEGGT
jgi:hypothetical protein